MGKCFTAVALFGMLVSGAFAQQRDKAASPGKPEAKPAQRFGTARPEPSGPAGAIPILEQVKKWPPPAASARMVLIRFVIAQVTLRGDERTPGSKPTAEARPAGEARPAKSPVLGMPEESLFDAQQLKRELEGKPLDLRSSSDRVGTRLSGLMKDRSVEIVNRGQLTTLDGQAAFVQLGQREPRITGVQMSPVGRTNMMTMQNVGMMAAFKPHVQDNSRISLQVQLEKSQTGPVEDGEVIAELPNGEKVRTPQVQTMVVQSAVTTAPGQAVALAGVTTHQGPRRTEFLILVSADLVTPE